MKKLLRSTFGTLVVAGFLAVAPPMYARGGHGGGHGGHRGGHGGHGVKHTEAGHVKGGHSCLSCSRWSWPPICGACARAARVMQGAHLTELAGGRWGGWGGYYRYPSYRSPGYSLGYYGLGYGYPYYEDITVTAPVGPMIPYYGYYPWGYYPYRYGYWPSVNFSFGFSGY